MPNLLGLLYKNQIQREQLQRQRNLTNKPLCYDIDFKPSILAAAWCGMEAENLCHRTYYKYGLSCKSKIEVQYW